MYDFFLSVAETMAEKGLRGLAEIVPGGGLVFDIAKGTWEKYRQRRQLAAMHEDVRHMVEATPEEVKQLAAKIAKETASEELRVQVELFLEQIPAAVRQSLKRADDPAGKSVPADFSLQSADDVVKLLPPSLPRFKPGDALPGRGGWILERHISGGGFGEVWLARNASVGFVRAVKFCKSLENPDRDLRHEASVIARLISHGKHPNVVSLYDAHLDGEAPWLMYEYVEGGDLGDVIRHWTRLPSANRQLEAVKALRILAKAVGRFHRLDVPIVHRDLKPANILYERKEKQLRITDFGIGGIAAREMIDGEKRGSLTSAGRLQSYLYGSYTPLYASPQQKASDPPDPRDDVHALGVLAYQMLTCQMTRGVGPDFVHDLQDLAVEPGLIDLVGRCAAQKAERRPKDAQELYERLAQLSADAKPAAAAKPVPAPAAESPADRVRRLKVEAVKLHDDARALIELHDYHAAAELLKGWPSELWSLRDAALFADTLAKRDRLGRLHKAVHVRLGSGKLDDPNLPALIAAFLALKPNDAEMLDLAREFPAPKPGQLITNTLGMKFAWVPPGDSWLGGGGGKPGTTPFTLEHGLWCGIYPVTQAEWQGVMGNNPSKFSGNPHYPVESVSWNDVQKFLEKLNARGDEFSYRLPTEQEWEYICRGGPIEQDQSKYHYYFAKSKTDLTAAPTNDLSSDKANFDGNYPAGSASKGKYLQHPSNVGDYLPNPLGIFDMHGNVWEWTGSSEVLARVFRGGCLYSRAKNCEGAVRGERGPDYSCCNVGFRLLAVPRAE